MNLFVVVSAKELFLIVDFSFSVNSVQQPLQGLTCRFYLLENTGS